MSGEKFPVHSGPDGMRPCRFRPRHMSPEEGPPPMKVPEKHSGTVQKDVLYILYGVSHFDSHTCRSARITRYSKDTSPTSRPPPETIQRVSLGASTAAAQYCCEGYNSTAGTVHVLFSTFKNGAVSYRLDETCALLCPKFRESRRTAAGVLDALLGAKHIS